MPRLTCLAIVLLAAGLARAEFVNLIPNGTLEAAKADVPDGFTLTGAATYAPLGDEHRDIVSRGVKLSSAKAEANLSFDVTNLAKDARWYRLTFRGLPETNFVADDLAIEVDFLGNGGKTSYDGKEKKLYEQVETARRDLGANGVHKKDGAEVWQTYQLDFMLPFPQVDQTKIRIGFKNGAAKESRGTSFLVDDLSLVAIPAPANAQPTTKPVAIVPTGKLIPIGGRWYYAAVADEATPKQFDHTNADRLIYKDDGYSAPFANNTSAWLRVGNLDAAGAKVKADTLIEDNVTITFDATSMIVKTHGVPNHPTGRYPEVGFGNPNAIQDKLATYYFPLEPKENPKHRVTDEHNQNGALHMGPIGLAMNGVVFFNPFDMGNTDATDMMDRCCGHPNQDNTYHYHKYPICVNTPWADEGESHSPLIGWAFDGYPMYGPYEEKDVMAKDETGDRALNAFNMHYDEARGWHYHVTPGKFPYLIGGMWGVEDARDGRRGPPGGGGSGGPGGRRPPPPGDGRGPPPR